MPRDIPVGIADFPGVGPAECSSITLHFPRAGTAWTIRTQRAAGPEWEIGAAHAAWGLISSPMQGVSGSLRWPRTPLQRTSKYRSFIQILRVIGLTLRYAPTKLSEGEPPSDRGMGPATLMRRRCCIGARFGNHERSCRREMVRHRVVAPPLAGHQQQIGRQRLKVADASCGFNPARFNRVEAPKLPQARPQTQEKTKKYPD